MLKKQLKSFCLHLVDPDRIFSLRENFLLRSACGRLSSTPATGTLRNPVSKDDSQRLSELFFLGRFLKIYKYF